MAQTHHFPADTVHFAWDIGLEPALEIESGDTVVVETRDVSDNQLGPQSTVDVLDGLDWARVYPLAGPIRVAAPRSATRSESRFWTSMPGIGDGRRSCRASASFRKTSPGRTCGSSI